MNTRSKIVWWVLALSTFAWLGLMCSGCARPAPTPPWLTLKTAAPPPPLMPRAVVPPGEAVYYFAATASADGLESDFSNECVWTNVNWQPSVGLRWDASVSATTNPAITYKIYWGGASRGYTNSVQAGTNLTVVAQVLPLPATNLVVTLIANVSSNWPAISWTNTQPQMFRGMTTRLTSTKYRVTPQTAPTLAGPWTTLIGWPVWTNSTRPVLRLGITMRYE